MNPHSSCIQRMPPSPPAIAPAVAVPSRHAWTAIAVAALLITTGCHNLALIGGTRIGPWKVREKIARATPANPAVRCVCLWQPASGVGLDNQTARGFAGQIFFFTNTSAEPVAVEGHLTIYVFDDQGTPEEQAHPIHTFEFRNDSFQPFLKATQFGPAYELFIPYTRKGLHAAECALRVKLEQRNGPVVLSELGYVQLPGLKSKAPATPPPTAAASPSLGGVRITPQPGKTIVHDLTHGGRPAASKEPDADERTERPTGNSLDEQIDAATAKARLQPATNGGFLKTREEIEPQIRAFLEQTLRKHATAAARHADSFVPETPPRPMPPNGFPAPERARRVPDSPDHRPTQTSEHRMAGDDITQNPPGEDHAAPSTDGAEGHTDAEREALATPSRGRFRLKPAAD